MPRRRKRRKPKRLKSDVERELRNARRNWMRARKEAMRWHNLMRHWREGYSILQGERDRMRDKIARHAGDWLKV